ncbi:MAG: hypothetical protein JW825_03010, partial [Candidatus Methanofastidiosa archaeon]|nr:hypothetical protein [Candidatus Methanofastidiosa archaeon]
MTEKGYYEDPFRKEFDAKIIYKEQAGDRTIVRLDKTFFYPRSGGQPNDMGTMDGKPVIDVWMEGDDICHSVMGDLDRDEVTCSLDWDRRFDNMQQHTGQHILSQAIYRLLGADSESLHIGAESSSIDIQIENLGHDDIKAIEDMANAKIFEDLPIRSCYVESTSGLDLRKETSLQKNIRIVEIADFDKTPCGGTHLRSSGQVGMIKIVRAYKKGKYYRVEFICGRRCLEKMQEQGRVLQSLGNELMVPEGSIAERVLELVETSRILAKRNAELEADMFDLKAGSMIAEAPSYHGIKTIIRELDDPGLAQGISKALQDKERLFSALAFKTGKGATLILSSSRDSDIDVG